MMDVQRFEQEILKLAFETSARLTPASVAYYLGVPSREANNLLNTLLEEGVLELDSDTDGNLYYRVPHQDIIARELEAFDDLSDDFEPLPEESAEPASASPLQSVSLVSADDQIDHAEPLSPSRHRPPEQSALRATDGAQGVVSARPTPPPQPPIAARAITGAMTTVQDNPTSAPIALDGVVKRASPSRQPRRGVIAGISRSMEPDAWVGNCGASSVIVTAEARCEPKPLSSSRPVLVSCEPDAPAQPKQAPVAQQAMTSSSWWDVPSPEQHTGAMVVSEQSNLPARAEDVEQPEHQPGIALLLSLILCGTGQIYNGEVSKGIMMMVLCFLLWFVLLGWVVHIWSIVDAVVVAERINRKKLTEAF